MAKYRKKTLLQQQSANLPDEELWWLASQVKETFKLTVLRAAPCVDLMMRVPETTLSVVPIALGQPWVHVTHSVGIPACSNNSTQVLQMKPISPQS